MRFVRTVLEDDSDVIVVEIEEVRSQFETHGVTLASFGVDGDVHGVGVHM
jgi:hypothetical protein